MLRWVGMFGALLGVAGASGPRYVTGYPYYQTQGQPVVWAQSRLSYFTDPGGLGAGVDHAAADALVAAAAGVWNLPVASITVGQGGVLAEHVSGANVSSGASGVVFPPDVAASNANAVPIAVVYDTDGSVTDLLLGQGASAPASCRQNGVTESVDAFDPAGYILHAIIVVNGRCTGAAPEQQMQLQYQLERVFGRVLGLAWSQANDNVFTGTPQPTYEQAMHWPILHPLDIVCGPYTYQCLPEPFQLRPDDIAGMVLLYPNAVGAAPAAGKTASLAAAEGVFGEVDFPTGQGMAGVNVLAQRQGAADGALEPWVEASGVTGTLFRRKGTSPFVAADGSAAGSEGANDQGKMGQYHVAYLPLQDGMTEQTVVVSTEAVNTLYTGTHSVEPYAAGTVMPSGTPPAPVVYPQATNDGDAYAFFTIADAASSCGTGLDGTLAEPVQAAASGWSSGLICGYGHAAYSSLNIRPGRSLTVEVTALDEQGNATTGKMMPVIGVYGPGDQVGDLPSVATAAGAFNALGLGTTRVAVETGALTQVIVGVADERGDGRPDFGYQERVFYADSVLPERVPVAGGTVTISGMGFRGGNRVSVNGVEAAVASWSSTAIVVTVPSMVVAGAADGVGMDVEVRDVSSGAVSTMTGALTYDSAVLPNEMRLVSAPGAGGFVGNVEATAFAVQVVAGDGVTPVLGEAVTLSSNGGAGGFSVCPAATCAVMTDARGMASTGVRPLVAGMMTVMATDGMLSQSASFDVLASDGSMVVTSAPSGSFADGEAIGAPFAVKVLGVDGKTGLGGRLVTFSVTQGVASYGSCAGPVCGVVSAADGTASVTVTPTAVGAVTLLATDGALTQSVSFASAASADVMQVVTAPAASAATGSLDAFVVRLLHADGVTPDAGEQVVFSVTGGAGLYPCGSATCAQRTGGDGTAGVSVESLSAGTFTVTASFGLVTQAATVTFSQAQGRMLLLSAPSGIEEVGVTTNAPFSVKVLGTDGAPVVGLPVAMGGPLDQVRMGCGLGSCLVTTDGNGVATTSVTPLRAGMLLITAQFGSLSQNVSFTGITPNETLIAMNPVMYLAEGVAVATNLVVTATENGAAGAGQNVMWTTTGAVQLQTSLAVTNEAGVAQVPASVGPLAAGETASATACVWSTVCAGFTAYGVAGDAMGLGVVSGGEQHVTAAEDVQPVVARVVDGGGDAVAGAAVTAYQTVSAVSGPCPVRGRCPAAPVLASGSSVAISGADGTVSVVPMTVSGVATETKLLMTVGVRGASSADVWVQP